VQFKLDGANPVRADDDAVLVDERPRCRTVCIRCRRWRDGSATCYGDASVGDGQQPIDLRRRVSITAPANGASVSGSNVAVTATAADDIGVVGVQFFLDGAPLGAEVMTPPYAIAWDTTLGALGAHTLSARARTEPDARRRRRRYGDRRDTAAGNPHHRRDGVWRQGKPGGERGLECVLDDQRGSAVGGVDRRR
jgi:hypothetical protein